MEKEPQPDSMSTVNIKPDYPPSEVYGSEPPPAYHKPQSSAVQVAKIVAVTVVLVSLVLGSFILASAYVTANASCRQLRQELELLTEAADRFQAPLQPEALVQEEPIAQKQTADPLLSEESKHTKHVKEIDNNNVDNNSDSTSDDSSDTSESSEEEDRTPIHFKLPLQLDFDDLAGALIDKNQKSRMNCVVEKKRAEEVVDHQPKTVRLPFGVNLTTDPRYEHLSGERMAIFCESGNVQSHTQPQEEEQEETIMIQPVMIPIPQSHFPTHMPQQMQPAIPQNYAPHPMETMRPPMPPMMRPQYNPMIRQNMPPMVPQQPQQPQQSQLPPNPILHQIAQQIITHNIMEAQAQAQRAREEQQQQRDETNQEEPRVQRLPLPEGLLQQVAQRIPIPEEVLTQLNRLPNRDVIVAVSEQDSDEDSESSENQPQEPLRLIQHQRSQASDMNGRQTYARNLPIDIPVNMMQQEQQEPQAAASEELRPHYVQPRSVRSVDALLPKSTKRVKRCACDCAC